MLIYIMRESLKQHIIEIVCFLTLKYLSVSIKGIILRLQIEIQFAV